MLLRYKHARASVPFWWIRWCFWLREQLVWDFPDCVIEHQVTQNVNARSQESFIQFALCSERLYGWRTPRMSSWKIYLPQSWAERQRQPMWFWQAQSKLLQRSLLKAPLYLSADSTEGNNSQRIIKTNPYWLKEFNNMVWRQDINYQHFFPIWWIARQNVRMHVMRPPRTDRLSLSQAQPVLRCPIGVFQLLLQAQVLRRWLTHGSQSAPSFSRAASLSFPSVSPGLRLIPFQPLRRVQLPPALHCNWAVWWLVQMVDSW